MNSACIISTAYAGPVIYFAALFNMQNVVLEIHEHFEKQSYRNRCRIYGPNGVLNMVIPIKKNKSRTPIAEVRIANEHDWQKLHWRTLCASYRSSPYFEYYEQDLHPFYTREYVHLFDFNQQLFAYFLKKLEFEKVFSTSSAYERSITEVKDLRYLSSAKKQVMSLASFEPYPQVFEERLGFVANLSIFDLMFNLGPESRSYLRQVGNRLL